MADEVLTGEQLAAVETLDRDVLVTAGAGTGKTRVLTHRVTHIVEQGQAAVDEILALTFTERAAREMKQRIVRRFRALGREDDRRRVETAYISTIHSFCARVLRENALEAGVDPYYVQLEDAEAALLQRQVFDALVTRAYAGGGPVVGLLAELGQTPLRDMVLAIYAHLRRLGARPQETRIAPPADLDAAAEAARQAVDEALALADAGATEALADMLAAAEEQRDHIETLLAAREFDWVTYDELSQAARLFKGNVGAKDHKPVVAQAKDRLLAFAEALVGHAAADRAASLRDLVTAFDADYRAAKDAQGFLDFDDLLAKTRDLFGTPDQPTATALRYRDRFKFFLMDEFQDTNRLQMSVVAPIVRPQTSFTVGDAKQSIYRFLYADVDIFRERERRLADAGGATLPLSENFRSHPQVIAFANALFGQLWAEEPSFPFGELKPGREFAEREGPRVEIILVPKAAHMRESRAREAEAVARRICELTGLGDEPPLMLTGRGDERPASFGDILMLFRATSDIQVYEDALGQYDIPYYTVSGRGFYDTQEVQDLRNLLAVVANPLDDVALAAVLRSPLVGVTDEALYWLGAPPDARERDDDDATPQGAGRIAARLERVETLPNLAAADLARLTEFRALLARLRQSAGSRVADLLDQAILATDYDLKVLGQRNGRRRFANIEKLRQIALAFQSSARFSLGDFLEHLETLKIVAERETEAATEAEDSDVVRLMTIHQAKGLEAPVVIVADLARGLRHPQEPAILSSEGELALRLRSPLTDEVAKPESYARLEAATIAADCAEDKRLFYVACTRAKEHLLLAGCAAGGDDEGGEEPQPDQRPSLDKPYSALNAWSLWVMKFLHIAQAPPLDEAAGARHDLPPPAEGPPADGRVIQIGDVPVLVRSEVPPPEAAPAPGVGARHDLPSPPSPGRQRRARRPLIARMRARIEAGEELDVEALAGARGTGELMSAAQAVADRLCRCPPSPARAARVSVTGAIGYAACPRRYELAEIERLPESGFADHGEDASAADRAEDEPALERSDDEPTTRGDRMHDLLSRLDFDADFEAELERLVADLPEGLRDDARGVLRRFRDGPLWDELRRADALHREVPFILSVEGGMLRGKADVLMRSGDEWTVIDYKASTRPDEYRQRGYRHQVTLYALACRQLLGAAPRRAVIYYLDHGEADEFAIEGHMLEAAAAALQQALVGIAAGDFPRRDGDACGKCGYAAMCRETDSDARPG